MLQNLHVKNLALIDESEVDFAGGLNILSGETGAGKSIIIGSINLALGGKVQKEMLRDPEKPALVELIFSVTEKQKQVLKQLDVETEDDEVILSRRITGGRGVSKVNGESVPASKVKEIASVLIDIHGQHEHQSLLSKKKHLEILDSYAKEEIEQPKKELAEAYKDYKKLVSELNDADVDEEERLREVSFLEYEVGEIEEAGLTVGEDEELETQYKRFINGKKIVEALNQAYQYTGGMDQASELTGRALRELSGVSVYDEKIADMEETLTQIDNLLGDFNREIADYLDDTDFDEETFYHLEKRLDEINHLKSKYGSSIEEILSACEAKQERLLRLKDYDTYLADLKEKVKNAEKKLQKSCEKVSDIRKKYAEKLVIAVTEALKDLNFLDVRFEIEVTKKDQISADGMDQIRFMISTNPGLPMRPVQEVASGGELSRIMLALKSVAAQADGVDTLIFDEIDTGISGETANRVAKKMAVISKDHQVIAITHLPQIAAMADSHYFIRKQTDQKNTQTMIRKLNESESLKEISRMISGDQWSETSMEHAKEMKSLADETKLY